MNTDLLHQIAYRIDDREICTFALGVLEALEAMGERLEKIEKRIDAIEHFVGIPEFRKLLVEFAHEVTGETLDQCERVHNLYFDDPLQFTDYGNALVGCTYPLPDRRSRIIVVIGENPRLVLRPGLKCTVDKFKSNRRAQEIGQKIAECVNDAFIQRSNEIRDMR